MRVRNKTRFKKSLKRWSAGVFSIAFVLSFAIGGGSLAFGTAAPDTFVNEPADISQVAPSSDSQPASDATSVQSAESASDAAEGASASNPVDAAAAQSEATNASAPGPSNTASNQADTTNAQEPQEQAASTTLKSPAKAPAADDEADTPAKPDPVDPGTINSATWDTSKSKTATNLDANMTSQVTLSLPSAEEQLVTDIVFVLDKSTSGTEAQTKSLALLQDLKAQIEASNAKVQVGVVMFNNKANVANDGNFFDLSTQHDDIEAAFKQELHSGTNTHAGLIAGEKMLDNDASVDASRKYLIFVSDGISYIYNENPTCTAWCNQKDMRSGWWVSAYIWQEEYGSPSYVPADWNAWLAEVGGKVANQGTAYEFAYDQPIPADQPRTDWQHPELYASSPDVALYKTYKEYQSIASKYNAYALLAGTNPGLAWGPSFMNYLANGKTVSFDQIKNDISYLVDAGSYVDDYMGYVEGDYNFDFVNEASALALKVGNETLSAEQTGDNMYGFGKNPDGTYRYELQYVPGDKGASEHFRWTVNVPVSNFAPVQLTYSVKLANPKTAAGTYGTYDKDGSQGLAGLYTNDSATLHPVTSAGTELAPEEFAKPTVSYTVKGSGSGNDNPANSDPKNNPPTTPADKPAEPPAPDTALDTGDNLPWALSLGALAASAGALAVALKRRNG